MRRIVIAFLIMLTILPSCKKASDEAEPVWSEEDWTIYHHLLTLQSEAGNNYKTWSASMDSMEAIDALHQFFLNDTEVTSATVGSQGIAVQYSNGFLGGIFLNPDDNFEVDSAIIRPDPNASTVISNLKSVVNQKKAVFLNPSYWERYPLADWIIASYNQNLSRAGFVFQNIYLGVNATLDQFTQLSKYGLIHVYSHGWAWPVNSNISDIYLMTGEKASDNISANYDVDIKNGSVMIAQTKTSANQWENVYWIKEKFVADHNDFSKDTVLFYGGFCFSFLGTWPEITNTFSRGAYFGFTWRVWSSWNASLAENLVDNLTDTSKNPPINTERWMVSPSTSKERWDSVYQLFCRIQYSGDATLTMWKDSLKIETSPVTNITNTSATCGGHISSDGGMPVISRGVCWSTSLNPTLDHPHTTDGSGSGSFSSNMTQLSDNTQYYVRAYVINQQGTFYGNERSFMTGSKPPYKDVTFNLVFETYAKNYDKNGNLGSEGNFTLKISTDTPQPIAENTLIVTFGGRYSGNMLITINPDQSLSFELHFTETRPVVMSIISVNSTISNIPFYQNMAEGDTWYTDALLPHIVSFQGRQDYPSGEYTIYEIYPSNPNLGSGAVTMSY